MFGGTWGTNNTQNQPQQPQNAFGGGTGAFGQPATTTGGFGTGAFGAAQPQTNAFGQPQQQPNAFGTAGAGFGAANNNAFGKPATTGFGAFGAAANPNTTTTTTNAFGGGGTAFGAAQPAAGGFGGGLGGTTTTGGFGTGAFGGGAWNKPATGFGATATTGGQGTAGTPYQAFSERDQAPGGSATLHYQTISCMPQYKNWSLEELRFQDYEAGRKTANSAGATTFGAPAAATTATGFGAAGATTTGFGAAANTGFGGGGAFGQPAANNNTTNAFGQPQQPATTGFGAFGQQNPGTNNTGGLFGQNNTATTTGFGQTPAAGTTGGLFGQNNQTQPTTAGFGAFGQAQTNQPKPFGGFGTGTGTTTGGFGTGAFGATQPQQNPTGGLFGQNNQAQPQQPTNGFGAFGAANNNNNAPKPGGLFGTGTTGAFGQPAQTGQTGGGLFSTGTGGGFGTGAFGGGGGAFGQNNQNQQNPAQQPAAGGLFGQPAQNQTQPALGGFGAFGQANQNQQNQQPAAGGGLFGPKPAGTGLFGNLGGAANTTTNPLQTQSTLGGGLFGAQNNAANNQGGGLFGPKPGGGLFGNNGATAATGGFGLAGPTAQNNTAGGLGASGLFGAFGQSTTNNTNNNLLASVAQQPQLTAAVDQPISNALPTFELLPASTSTALTVTKKQPNFFNSVSKPTIAAAASKTSSKPFAAHSTAGPLRGFTSTSSPFGSPLPSANSFLIKGGGLGGPLGGGLSESRNALGPEAFNSASPTRQSVKKLVLDRPARTQDLSSLIQKASSGTKKIVFDPMMESQAREKDNLRLKLGGGNTQNAPLAIPARPASPVKQHSAPAPQSDSREKGDYWIKPSVAELQQMGFTDLQALRGFTCGRIGYGQVEFLDPVDLTSVHSIASIPGKIITFEDRECTVYPNEAEKPPRGEGLNVPARIKLLGCWATDKATREPIKDETHPKFASHLRKLKSIPETEFEDYDAEVGEWTFKVKHFSRYGLDADDDDDEDQDEELPPATQQVGDESMEHDDEDDDEEEEESESEESVTPPPVSTSRRSVKMLTFPPPQSSSKALAVIPNRRLEPRRFREVDQDMSVDVEGAEADNSNVPWPAQLGVDPQRMHVMQASLFASSGNEIVKRRGPTSASNPIYGTKLNASTSSLGKHPRESAIAAESTQRKPSVERTSFAAPLAFKQPQRKFTKIAKESIVEGQEHIRKDAGLALGRSFRVGWGPGGTLVHVGTVCGIMDISPPVESLSTVKITKLPLLAADEEKEKQQADELLRLQVQHTQVENDANGIPYAYPRPTINFQSFSSLFHPDNTGFEASVWRLGSALFDDISLRIPPTVASNSKVVERVQEVRRKSALSDWLKSAVSSAVSEVLLESRSSTSAASRIFTALSGNQIEQACKLAMDSGNLRLATLISQIGGSVELREDLKRQLKTWKDGNTDAWIDEDILKIYALVAGEVDKVTASKSSDPIEKAKDIHVSGSLDWKRAFGLQLWFGSMLQEPISASIETYERRFTSNSNIASPSAWYVELKNKAANGLRRSITSRSSMYGTVNDALFELIKLFVDPEYKLETALTPRGFSPSYLDFRLPWHLYMILSRARRLRDFERDAVDGEGEDVEGLSHVANVVTASYALQLEHLGMIDHATFVLLHLEDSQCREDAIKELLARNADKIDGHSELILESLMIPSVWISSAKAALYRSRGDAFAAYEAFLQADDHVMAHDIAMYELAPDAIIRQDLQLLRSLFKVISPDRVLDWRTRGKLLVDYSEAMHAIPELVRSIASHGDAVPDAIEESECNRLATLVPLVIRSLPDALRNTTDKRQKAALDEMLSGLVQRANVLDTVRVGTARIELNMDKVESAARLRSIHQSAFDNFCKSLEVYS